MSTTGQGLDETSARQLLEGLRRLQAGDLTVHIPTNAEGTQAEIV